MRFLRRFNRWGKSRSASPTENPLREFVYLDEVSLVSLLSSQVGEVKDSTSNQTSGSFAVDVGTSASVGVAQVGKSEATTQFQTSNSSTLQTSRKSTVQSWFRDLYNLPDVRLIQPLANLDAISDLESLKSIRDNSKVLKSSDLFRGALVEFRVEISPDPIFHLSTMLSEFFGMADDFPEMLVENNASSAAEEARPINKILQRLLAGLIPIRAKSLDYVVIEIEEVERIVHRELISGFDVPQKPLEIVAVTEHLAYWKDIRRVLFSGSEFTILCRVSRRALQDSWTPVKLADLFKDLVPELPQQIKSAGDFLHSNSETAFRDHTGQETAIMRALLTYKTEILHEVGLELSSEHEGQIFEEIMARRAQGESASSQRAAFSAIKNKISLLTGMSVDEARDLELRELSREKSGLSLFPSAEYSQNSKSRRTNKEVDEDNARLIDVEVVAIYW